MEKKKKSTDVLFPPSSVLVFLNLHVIPLPIYIYICFILFQIFFFFLMWTIFEVLPLLVFLFSVLFFFFCLGILTPQPGIELIPRGLEGEVLTIGPPGRSWFFFFLSRQNWMWLCSNETALFELWKPWWFFKCTNLKFFEGKNCLSDPLNSSPMVLLHCPNPQPGNKAARSMTANPSGSALSCRESLSFLPSFSKAQEHRLGKLIVSSMISRRLVGMWWGGSWWPWGLVCRAQPWHE